MSDATRKAAPIAFAGAVLAVLLATAAWLLLKTPRSPEPAGGAVEDPCRPEPASREAPLAPERAQRLSPSAFVDPEKTHVSAAASETGAVTGEVLFADGSPANNIFVFCGPADSISFLGYEESLRQNLAVIRSPTSRPAGILTTLTDARGSFSFQGIKPAWKLTVGAWHGEFGLVSSRGILIRPGESPSVTLRFPSHVRFTGYVTEPNGRPVPGAQVEVRGARTSLEKVTIAADGSYQTSRWPGIDFALTATSPEHYDDFRSARGVGPAELERRVDFQLVRAPKVTGRLVLADGSPAKVKENVDRLKDPDDPDWRFGLFASYADPRQGGRFAVPQDLGGRIVERDDTYELVIKVPRAGFIGVGLKRTLLGADSLPSDLSKPGPDIVIDWSVAPQPVKRGALVITVKSTADSAPVTRYTLRVEDLGPEPDHARSSFDVKSADGRHRVERLREGPYRVSVAAQGFSPASKETDVVGGRDDNEVVVPMSPSLATIAGLVLGPVGKPVESALVWVTFGRKQDVPMPSLNVLPRAVRTDATGAFRLEGLQSGTYRVIADAEGLARGWTYASPQPIESNVMVKLEEGVLVEIVPEGSKGPFFLFVNDRDSHECVFGLPPDPRPSGEQLILRLKPGSYDVSLGGSGFKTATGTVRAIEGASLRLRLRPEREGELPETRNR
jgi:Carboxypeptidase regulatory-like domain